MMKIRKHYIVQREDATELLFSNKYMNVKVYI